MPRAATVDEILCNVRKHLKKNFEDFFQKKFEKCAKDDLYSLTFLVNNNDPNFRNHPYIKELRLKYHKFTIQRLRLDY